MIVPTAVCCVVGHTLAAAPQLIARLKALSKSFKLRYKTCFWETYGRVDCSVCLVPFEGMKKGHNDNITE